MLGQSGDYVVVNDNVYWVETIAARQTTYGIEMMKIETFLDIIVFVFLTMQDVCAYAISFFSSV